MSVVSKLTDVLLGDKRNTETRHRPTWWPGSDFDHRWLNERFAIFTIAPYSPPFRRHIRFKAWVCMGPNNCIHRSAIVDVDLDERELEVDVYK